MPITHSFVSAKSDGGDTTLVRPSDWNANHLFPEHPEFADNVSGTPIDMSGAATGTGVTFTQPTGFAGLVDFTDGSYQHWDVTNSSGTGNFDVRWRITDFQWQVTSASSVFRPGMWTTGRDFTSDPGFQMLPDNTTTAGTVAAFLGTAQQGSSHFLRLPIVVRMARSGTTITWYMSRNDGQFWQTIASATSSVNIGKVGARMHVNGATNAKALVHYIRS